MAVFRWLFEQDITKPIKMRHDEGMTFTGDNDSYTIGVSLYNDGAAYSPSGSVSCNVIRSDGVTVSFLGTVEGNKAIATLPANCLSVPGPIGIYIKVTSGSSVTTVFAGVYTVQATSTGSSVVPSETLTDIDALIAAVEAAVETIPPDYSDVINALPAVTGYVYPFPVLTWTTGTYVNKDTGEIGTDDTQWSACDYIPIDPAYGKIKIVSVGASPGIYNAYYNASKEYVGPLSWNSNTTTIIQPPLDAAYIRLSRRNDTTVTVSIVPITIKELLRENSIEGKTVSETFTPAPQTAHGENTGENLRVMQYNISGYNHDSSVYLPDEKLYNLRKLLRTMNPDVIGLQEADEYIDSGDTRLAQEYVWNPQYPYGAGLGDVVICSKRQMHDTGIVKASTNKSIRYGVLTVGSCNVLILSHHCPWRYQGNDGESAASIAARNTQFIEAFRWAKGQITLNDYYSGSPVSAPEHSHVVLMFDANCATSTDKSNLQAAASTYGYTLANGGEMGWIYSCLDAGTLYSIDIVAVSSNVIINGLEVLENWYPLLYSDHYPVIADLTLTERSIE